VWGQILDNGTRYSLFLLQIKDLGRPVSRILLYPAIHLRDPEAPGPFGAAPTSPASRLGPPGQFGLLAPVVYLAGPSQDTAGGLLPHPFTHHLCRKVTSGHRLVCSLLHLTWRRAYAIAAPRVLNPSGLCYESGLCSVPWEIPGYSDGSDGPDPVRIIP
jgi:hypothetical protein